MILDFAAADLGDKDEAIAEGKKSVALIPIARDAYSAPGYAVKLTQLYVRVETNDEAVEVIRKLLAVPAGIVMSRAYLKLDPIWEPLHENAGFQALRKDD